MDIRQKLINRRWYFQGFNGTLTLLAGGARSAPVEMPQRLGYGYSAIIMYFEDDKCYFLYAWDDMNMIMRELRKRVKKDKSYLEFLNKEDEKACRESMRFFRTVENLDKKSLEELKEQLIGTDKAYANVLSVSHIVEGWVHPTENLIRDMVSKHALAVLTSPAFDSFLTKEQRDLMNIATYAKKKGIQKLSNMILQKDKKIRQMLEEHQKKYFWKNNSYASAKILAVEDFMHEVNELLQKPKKFADIVKRREEKKKILKEMNDAELTELIEINDTIFRIHDRRKEHMTISMHYLELILKELNKRTKIPMELLRYVLPEEVTNIDVEELKKRRKRCIYFVHPTGHSIFTGKKADKYISILEKQHQSEHTEIIRGNSASPGKVRGIVKICRGEKELCKVEKGDILVACMTQPEFVPAMKKAAAIITDEGGLTCHAAIVSRELGIPCIIGTKIATKVLKDGQLVEVNANHGWVKIIK